MWVLDNPAPPRSWMPTTKPAAYNSRQHSMSTFSVNGSPTCTLAVSCGRHRFVPEKVSEANTDTRRCRPNRCAPRTG